MSGRLVLVFDDGYETDESLVRPVLEEYDARGCFAVVPGWFDREGYLDAEHLRALEAGGHEVLAHGKRHRFLQRFALADGVEAGDDRVVVKHHVFPEKPGGLYVGDTLELTDGNHREVGSVSATGGGDELPFVEFESAFGTEFDSRESVLRFTEDVVREEVVGAAAALAEAGLDASGFVFPYGAADLRAWRGAREHYDTLPNVACRSLPNRSGAAPTDLRRYYFETTHLSRVEIDEYLGAVAATGGLGVLAGHSGWDSVTEKRLRYVLEAAEERDVAVTTFRDLHEENWF